jgi:large subunit ribosomal protein L35Ae
VNFVSKTGEGVIVSCRRGPKTQKPNEYILRFPGIESVGGAARLLGRKVGWPVGKHQARGKIVALHGKNGLVRARFRKGMPGQALGSPVEIIG